MYKWLLSLLISIPFFFKIELFEGFRILPQEPFILLLVIFISVDNIKKKTPLYSLPYICLNLSLFVIVLSSLISLFFVFDIIGLIKTFKYLLYAYSIFLLLTSDLIKEIVFFKILVIGKWVICISLILYAYWFSILGMSWQEFVSFTTWHAEYMPTGLGNIVFDISTGNFYRSGGNHGIYGTYLVLLFILSVYQLKKSFYKKGKFLIVLILVNISFLTSRETILLLFVTIAFTAMYSLTKLKVNRKAFYLFVGLLGVISVVLIVWQPEFVLLNKIEHMLNSLSERGKVDNNVSYRFNTWTLYFGYAFTHISSLIFGIGYNRTRFENILSTQETIMGSELSHVSVPESFYITTLAYGGILSFILGLLFFCFTIYFLSKKNFLGPLFLFYVIGLMITNGTGSSILAELMISQLGLVYVLTQKFTNLEVN